jgi:hypothetical protein
VVLIHEKKRESWTRLVWERLKVRRGQHLLTLFFSQRKITVKRSHELTVGCWTRFLSQAAMPKTHGRIRLVHHWNSLRVLPHAHAVLDTYPYGKSTERPPYSYGNHKQTVKRSAEGYERL